MSFRLSPIDELAKLLASQTSKDLMLEVLEALKDDLGAAIFHFILERLIRYLSNRQPEKKKR